MLHIAVPCSLKDELPKQTNADRIRAMSDERLALLLVVTEFEDVPSEYYDDETQIIFRSVTGKRFYYKEQAIQDNLEWLKKEVEDE